LPLSNRELLSFTEFLQDRLVCSCSGLSCIAIYIENRQDCLCNKSDFQTFLPVASPVGVVFNTDFATMSLLGTQTVYKISPDRSASIPNVLILLNPAVSLLSPNSLIVGSGRDSVILCYTSINPGTILLFMTTTNPINPITLPNITSGLALPITSQFRPSIYQYKEDLADGPIPVLQTNAFRNSYFNIVYYNNPNFQPEQWTPDCKERRGEVTR
jgi:hypothetical protein